MLRLLRNTLIGLAVTGAGPAAWAFSLMGPALAWQSSALNYNWEINGTLSSVGVPKNLGESYRWNQPTIYYAFDRAFLEFFGQRGVAEVEKAIQLMNNLPPASQINLDNYPLKTERINYRAQALGIFDLKTAVLQTLLQELGVGDPEYALYNLRARWTTPATTNYYVIKRNFDPVTWQPTSYINGDLWSYITIFDNQNVPISAIEYQHVDPLAYGNPVSSDEASTAWSNLSLISTVGKFFIGLTRDDMAALRYIYHPLNLAVETAPTNAFVAGFGSVPVAGVGGFSSPWAPFGSGGSSGGTNWLPFIITTNVVIPGVPGTGGATNTTNFIVDVALRPGRDHVQFKRVEFDSLVGGMTPFIDTFVDTFITNGAVRAQTASRVMVLPDIVFTAADLFTDGAAWQMVARSQEWVNNAALNRAYILTGTGPDGGPGTIQSPNTAGMVVVFNNSLPGFYNVLAGPGGAFLSEANPGAVLPVWGSFDASTNAPVLYPSNITLEQLDRRALSGP